MVVTSLPAIRVLLTRTMPSVFGGSQAPTASATLPIGYDSSHRGTGYVKSKNTNQWTPFASRERTRLDDESEVELATTTTRVDIKAQPSPDFDRQRDIRGSVLSTLSKTLGG